MGKTTIRKERIKLKLTQLELANAVNCSENYIGYLERGAFNNPSINIANRISYIFGLTIEDFEEFQ